MPHIMLFLLFLADRVRYHGILADQVFRPATGVGGACAGKAGDGKAEALLVDARAVLLPEGKRGLARAKDMPDFACGKDAGKVIGSFAADRGIRRSPDPAAFKHIPQRDAVADEEILPLPYGPVPVGTGVGEAGLFSEYPEKDWPEPVLRMHVEEACRAAFGGGKSPQHKYPASAVPDRRNLVNQRGIRFFQSILP